MKVFTYSEARQNLARLLALAQSEEIEIRRRDGKVYSLKAKGRQVASPFDVPGLTTLATTSDVLDALRESRER